MLWSPCVRASQVLCLHPGRYQTKAWVESKLNRDHESGIQVILELKKVLEITKVVVLTLILRYFPWGQCCGVNPFLHYCPLPSGRTRSNSFKVFCFK